jgi:hypothetical protein
MKDRQNYRITLDNIENKVFFIDHCNHLIKSYFEQNLEDCIVDDDNDMLSHQYFVRTKSEYGLNKAAALSIEAVLNAV